MQYPEDSEHMWSSTCPLNTLAGKKGAGSQDPRATRMLKRHTRWLLLGSVSMVRWYATARKMSFSPKSKDSQ